MAIPIGQVIWNTIQEEFFDAFDVAQFTRISLRILLAAILGGILGYEREQMGKAAGLRTHMLVALGAAVFIIIPQQAGATVADLTRVLQGLVAGIGFLGAGAIIKGNDQEEAKGVTTAAGLWLTTAIGVAAGMGRETSALLITFLALIILSLLPKFTQLFEKPGR